MGVKTSKDDSRLGPGPGNYEFKSTLDVPSAKYINLFKIIFLRFA